MLLYRQSLSLCILFFFYIHLYHIGKLPKEGEVDIAEAAEDWLISLISFPWSNRCTLRADSEGSNQKVLER